MLRRNIIFSVAIALAFTWIVLSFALRASSTVEKPTLPRTAVVFTGQFDRVEKGLALLEENSIGRLFISGANGGAGMRLETFARQFNLSTVLQDYLTKGRITLAAEAQDTIENALETSCWLSEYPKTERVLLITSQLHMPRASLALERASGVRVERLVTGAAGINAGDLLNAEFWKYVGTWFVTLLPTQMWPARSGFSCEKS